MKYFFEFSNFYLVFGYGFFSAKFDFFTNFDVKNHYEILVIQTHPFTSKQTGIQTLSHTKNQTANPFRNAFSVRLNLANIPKNHLSALRHKQAMIGKGHQGSRSVCSWLSVLIVFALPQLWRSVPWP